MENAAAKERYSKKQSKKWDSRNEGERERECVESEKKLINGEMAE